MLVPSLENKKFKSGKLVPLLAGKSWCRLLILLKILLLIDLVRYSSRMSSSGAAGFGAGGSSGRARATNEMFFVLKL